MSHMNDDGCLDPYYEEQLQNYDDETDMCNQLGLNYDDIYTDSNDEDEDEDYMSYTNDDEDEDGYTEDSYEEWLEKTGLEDSEENRGWYDCPEDEKADYIENHQDWWDSFGE